MPHTTTNRPHARTTIPAAAPAAQAVPQDALRLLRLLFELAQDDQPAHVAGLAAHLGLSTPGAAKHLLQLEGMGLAQADRARLTMAGLVVASRLPAVASPAGDCGTPRRARAPRQLPPGFLAVQGSQRKESRHDA